MWNMVHYGDSSDEELENLAEFPRNHRWRKNFQRDGYNREKGSEFKVKMDLPSFNGQLHMEDFLDQLSEGEKFFEFMEIPEEKQVKYVAYKLKCGASAWWDQMQLSRTRVGKPPVKTWMNMKQMLRGRYLPLDYDQVLFQQYHNCKQGNRSVDEYTTEFYRLASRNDLTESDSQQAARFISGLKYNIQDRIALQTAHTLGDVVCLALRAETMMEKPQNRNFGSVRNFNHSIQPAIESSIDYPTAYQQRPGKAPMQSVST